MTLRQWGRSVGGHLHQLRWSGARFSASDRQWCQALIMSSLIHVCLIGLASCFWMVLRHDPGMHSIDTRWMAAEESALEPALLEELPAETDESMQTAGGSPQVSFSFQQAAMPPSQLASLSGDAAPILPAPTEAFGDLSQPVTVTTPAKRSGSGSGEGAGAGAGFFGSKAAGRRIVYVVDCSRSMNHPHPSEHRTRFKRLKVELLRSVYGMNREMQFFIIFFNETAIPMPARSLQPAVSSLQKKYLYWMQSVRADGETDPVPALQMALKLQPDVIYFLTDGSFKRSIEVQLLKLAQGDTTIHTFSFRHDMTAEMQEAIELVKSKDARKAARLLSAPELRYVKSLVRAETTLRGIAARNGGQYHLIP